MGSQEAKDIPLVRDGSTLGFIATVVSLVGSALVARRRGAARPAAFGLYIGVLLAASVLAVVKTTGAPFPYLFRWMWGIGMLTWVSIGWSLWAVLGSVVEQHEALSGRHEVMRRSGKVLARVSVVLLVLVGCWQAIGVDVPRRNISVRVAALTEQITNDVPKSSYVVRWEDMADLAATSIGVATELERSGYDLRFPPSVQGFIQDFRIVSSQDEALPTLLIIGRPDAAFDPPAGATEVAAYDPLPKAQRSAVIALGNERDALVTSDPFSPRIGEIDHELQAYADIGVAYKVWLVPPATG